MGTRIRQLRKMHKLTQAQLGEMCNASKSAVSQWESDQTLPTLANILALHDRLAFSLDWLLAGDGHPNDEKRKQNAEADIQRPGSTRTRRRAARGPVGGDLCGQASAPVSHGSVDWLHDRRIYLGPHAADSHGQQCAGDGSRLRRAHARRGQLPADLPFRIWVRRPTTRPAIDEARWREIRPPAKK